MEFKNDCIRQTRRAKQAGGNQNVFCIEPHARFNYRLMIIIFLFTIFTLLGTSCGDAPKETIPAVPLTVATIEEEPQETQVSDWTKVDEAVLPTEDGPAKLYYENVFFTIVEETHEANGTGKATIKVTTPDMASIFKDVLRTIDSSKGLSDEEMAKAAENRLNELLTGEHDKVTSTIEVQTKNVGDAWKIVPDEKWDAAISGNMVELYRQYSQEILLEGLK